QRNPSLAYTKMSRHSPRSPTSTTIPASAAAASGAARASAQTSRLSGDTDIAKSQGRRADQRGNDDHADENLIDLEPQHHVERCENRSRGTAERRHEEEQTGRPAGCAEVRREKSNRIGRDHARNRGRDEERRRRSEQRRAARIVDAIEDQVE